MPSLHSLQCQTERPHQESNDREPQLTLCKASPVCVRNLNEWLLATQTDAVTQVSLYKPTLMMGVKLLEQLAEHS